MQEARANSHSSTCRSDLVGPDLSSELLGALEAQGLLLFVLSWEARMRHRANLLSSFQFLTSCTKLFEKQAADISVDGSTISCVWCAPQRTLCILRQLRICRRHRFSKMFLVGNLRQTSLLNGRLEHRLPTVSKTADPEDFQVTAGKVMGPGWKPKVAIYVAVAASLQCVRKETRHHHNRLG